MASDLQDNLKVCSFPTPYLQSCIIPFHPLQPPASIQLFYPSYFPFTIWFQLPFTSPLMVPTITFLTHQILTQVAFVFLLIIHLSGTFILYPHPPTSPTPHHLLPPPIIHLPLFPNSTPCPLPPASIFLSSFTLPLSTNQPSLVHHSPHLLLMQGFNPKHQQFLPPTEAARSTVPPVVCCSIFQALQSLVSPYLQDGWQSQRSCCLPV